MIKHIRRLIRKGWYNSILLTSGAWNELSSDFIVTDDTLTIKLEDKTYILTNSDILDIERHPEYETLEIAI